MCRLSASSVETIWFGRRSSGSSVDMYVMHWRCGSTTPKKDV